jgi:hypothetical protein
MRPPTEGNFVRGLKARRAVAEVVSDFSAKRFRGRFQKALLSQTSALLGASKAA